jgi:YVTN family beta-propeller protein
MKHLLPLSAVIAAVAVTGLMPASPALAQTVPTYTITRTIALGAPDRWDYVVFDPDSHRVFVAHGDRVTVVDTVSGTVTGQVEGFPGGTHGIGISTPNGHGYSDDGSAGTVSSFNLKTLKIDKTLKADDDADGIAFDAVSGHLFVINGESGTVTVIDPKTNAVVATVKGEGNLEFGVSGSNGKFYVDGAAKNEIVRIDTKTNLADAHWPMPTCTNPRGIAMDTSTHRVFSSCANGVLVVIDTDTGATVATLPIGKGTDGAAFDPKRKLIFSSNGQDGTISIIQEKDPQTFVAAGTIKTAVTGRTMGIDPGTGRLFVVAADVDTSAAANAASGAAPRRAPIVPGSLKLMFVDPTL